MRILNFNSKTFAVGRTITTIKEYQQGNIHILIGDKGTIEKITVESFPDMGLFNLKIIHMDFGLQQLSMGEEVAERYFKV